MCVICVKPSGIHFPTKKDIQKMWDANPDGAGYMFVRDQKVIIRKGFMTIDSLLEDLAKQNLTKKDVVVYHFRISTQAKTREMTHPFPLTNNIDECLKTELECRVGIAHNGIIRMTSNPLEKKYNDTSLFITKYLTKIIHSYDDLDNIYVTEIIEKLTNSKFAILDRYGKYHLVGQFFKENGLLYSNLHHKAYIDYYSTLWDR